MKITISLYYEVCAASLFTVQINRSLSTTDALYLYQVCLEDFFQRYLEGEDSLQTLLRQTFDKLETICPRHQILIDSNLIQFDDWDEVDQLLRQDLSDSTSLAFTCDEITVCSGEEGSMDRFVEIVS